MRKISVQLDNLAEEALKQLLSYNRCTISDIVNAAILAMSKDKQPLFHIDHSPWRKFKDKIKEEFPHIVLKDWCVTKDIDINRLRYLVTSTERGSTVSGFGNTKNKWRDKQDERQFKTHTSWIAYCLKQDFDIDIV